MLFHWMRVDVRKAAPYPRRMILRANAKTIQRPAGTVVTTSPAALLATVRKAFTRQRAISVSKPRNCAKIVISFLRSTRLRRIIPFSKASQTVAKCDFVD